MLAWGKSLLKSQIEVMNDSLVSFVGIGQTALIFGAVKAIRALGRNLESAAHYRRNNASNSLACFSVP